MTTLVETSRYIIFVILVILKVKTTFVCCDIIYATKPHFLNAIDKFSLF